MLKYILSLFFVIFGNSYFLLDCWGKEICRMERISYRAVWRECRRDEGKRVLFWWRLASEMHRRGGFLQRAAAKKINRKYSQRYGHNISIKARIGLGLILHNPKSVIIDDSVAMGQSVILRGKVTIKSIEGDDDGAYLWLGDNVDIGDGVAILGVRSTVGDSVVIEPGTIVTSELKSNSRYRAK